jgi:hypothetical protein
MSDLRKLRVRPGEPVLPAWNRLLEWAKQFRLVAGPGVRLQRTPQGTYVVADLRSRPWHHPFKVTLADQEARVAFGTVENVVPRIGGRLLDEEPAPSLRLHGGPDPDGRSWVAVAVKVKVSGESGRIDAEDKEAVEIVHVRALRPADPATGLHPLAMLVWDGSGSVVRVRQITHFNLGHLRIKGDGEAPGRHLFWAT